MIIKQGKQVAAIFHDGKAIQEVRRGLTLVWQAIRSCFGKGLWLNAKPWSNTDAWTN